MSMEPVFLSPLGATIADYLALKEALGRKYALERRAFIHLDRFLARDKSDLTADSFARWCATLVHLSPTVRRNRMRMVRNLCLYQRRSNPNCFMPDLATFPRPHVPRQPYCFSQEDILRLLRAAGELEPSPNSQLRPQVFRLAIVLLYTAGLRRGELIRLRLADYDAAERALTVRATKFHKSRVVPLSDDAACEMEHYLQARRTLPHDPSEPLLCNCNHSRRQHPYTGAGLAQGLTDLFRRAGLRTPWGQRPRVHDVRHSFALQALLRWYRAGDDVQVKLPALATYMGHVSIVSTYHYLRWLEPLTESVSERFARHCDPWLPTSSEGESR